MTSLSQVGVAVSEQWIPKANGIEIYTRTWTPADPKARPVVACVLFVHGLGEHCNRYNHVFPLFALAGIKVLAFDQRGFGRTARRSGQLGDSQGLQTVFQDIKDLTEQLRIGQLPLFLMGQSMGGGIVLRFASLYPEGICGVISCCKYIPSQRLARAYHYSTTLDPKCLSRDPTVAAAYSEDPYVHPWITTATALSITTMAYELQTIVPKAFNLPVLVTHGTMDKITCPNASKKFVDEIQSSDKSYRSFDGAFHEYLDRIETILSLASAASCTASYIQKGDAAMDEQLVYSVNDAARRNGLQPRDNEQALGIDLIQIFRALSAVEQEESKAETIGAFPHDNEVEARMTKKRLDRTVLLLMAQKMPGMTWDERLQILRKI
eukprot:jgi/Hompol1/2554/HPOL_002953-RA